MDLERIIAELYDEKRRLNRVIEALEAMQESGTGPVIEIEEKKRRGRKFMDADARREVSERMKRYWAERRKGTISIFEDHSTS